MSRFEALRPAKRLLRQHPARSAVGALAHEHVGGEPSGGDQLTAGRCRREAAEARRTPWLGPIQPAALRSQRRLALGVLAIVVGLCMRGVPAALAGPCRIERFPAWAVALKDLQPLVQARINGVAASFIVDTGAFWSVISPAARAQYDLTESRAPPGFYVQGVGGASQPEIATVRTFTFLHLSLHDMEFLVAGNAESASVAGVLGDNLWRIDDVEYDFAQGVIRFDRAIHCGDQSLAYWAGSQPVGIVRLQRISARHPQLIGHARINGRRIRVVFDTGTPRSMLTLAAAKRLGITPDSPGVQPLGKFFGGIGRDWRHVWIAPVASFEIGGVEKIQHTHLLVGDFAGLGEADLYLGEDFFLSHHVYVSNSQHRLYFTYNGGPVFALGRRYLIHRAGAAAVLAGPGAPPAVGTTASAATAAAGPDRAAPGGASLAAELAHQGMALSAEGRNAAALADLTRACRLDPKNAGYRYHRGRIHEALKQPARALADFNRALALQPGLVEARLARAALLLYGQHAPADAVSEARTDINIVALQVPDESMLLLPLSRLYARVGEYAAAIREVDQWIYYHRHDARLPIAWDVRCWSRAQADIELRKALKDCDRALGRLSKSAPILDSRGLVYLRLDEPDRAIADYDAALAINPRIPTSLYGRGIAELRKGETAQGQADLAAALKIDPGVGKRFARMQLAPQ